MNRFFLLFMLFCSTFFFAQKKESLADSTQVKKNFFKIYSDDLLAIKPALDFSIQKNTIAPLSVYNSFSKHNDVYFLQNGTYYSMRPSIVLENNFMGTKKDSFNPYGAPNVGSAIVLGFMNVLFEKL